MIKDGKVFLGWKKIDNYNEILEDWDILKVEDCIQNTKIMDVKNPNQAKILLLNKPIGYIVSKSEQQWKSIYNILPSKYKNWYYIWRLDKDSCGLILFTNDSKLVNLYSHPSNKIEKEYEVVVSQKLSDSDIKKTLTWISDKDDKLLFKDIKFIWLNWRNKGFVYRVLLEEWKNRHIRRVFSYFWLSVFSLKRLREGKFSLWNIESWKYIEVDV